MMFYIDLAIANTGWEAWRNIDTVEYWNRKNTRNKKYLLWVLWEVMVALGSTCISDS